MRIRLLIAICLVTLAACSPEPVREPAQVTSHIRVNKTLDDCQRLGQVRATYTTSKKLSQRENEIRAQQSLKQKAYDEYRANHIVFINTRYVKGGYREPDTIHSRGIAYLCK